jgi:hypothetical protein
MLPDWEVSKMPFLLQKMISLYRISLKIDYFNEKTPEEFLLPKGLRKMISSEDINAYHDAYALPFLR